ncbi:MAG: XRE family transcriptional regulator [Chitinispirillaceae bacterium]|nr:XRE family transcriptional regulator [Chitinispirillaceae bacterium]
MLFILKCFIITAMNTVLLKEKIVKIGMLIKAQREKSKRKQSEIAAKAGISISMLSQIERGVVAPSVETLIMVCEALNVDTAELLKKVLSKEPVRIHHHGERLFNHYDGVKYEQLMTSLHSIWQAELFLLEIAPGKSTSFQGKGHEGAEMGYILKGEAILSIDNRKYNLSEGDSIYFDAQHPHQLSNCGKKTFKAIWSISPPHIDFLGVNT